MRLGAALPQERHVTALPGRLALALQEAFTVTVRLRSGRPVAQDAQQFRAHAKNLLARADQELRAAGTPGEDSKLAIYAFVAFLDESVLNSSQPMFAEWPRQPLQEEVFGDHMGGENFFKNLSAVMARPESRETADLLEVFQLCLLLGFRGRYGGGDSGAISASLGGIEDKIGRIRGPLAGFGEAWRLPENETAARSRDPWVRRLGIAALVTIGLAVVLFIAFRFSLGSGVDDLASAAVPLSALLPVRRA